MRALIVLLAVFLAGPAAAQSWKEYAYPDYSFAVAFPADPDVETVPYQTADGGVVDARIYSVTQDGAVFRMTIVQFPDPAPPERAVMDHAVKTLSEGGEIKVDIPARINRVFGRQLSIVGADGSHASVAIFYHRRRLYQIEGIALPSGGNATSAAIRFQQSLVFTGGESNRAPDVAQEPRRRCRGDAEAEGAADVAAQQADERCRRRGR